MVDIFCATFIGATVYFAKPDVFKGTLTQTLAHAKPTMFLAVPRVWEKLEEKISSNLDGLTGLKAKLFKWATNTSLTYLQAGYHSQSRKTIQYKIADKLVLGKVRKLLGIHHFSFVYAE